MHRQAEHRLAEPFADREIPFPAAQPRERLLQMERLGVIDHDRDSSGLQGVHDLRAVPGVLRLHRIVAEAGEKAVRHRGGLEPVLQQLRVTLRRAVAVVHFLVEGAELRQKDRRLERVEPRVEPEADVVVFERALSVNADRFEDLVHLRVVREHRAPVAVAAERLRGEKARCGKVPEAARLFPVDAAPEALRGVLHEHEAVLPADGGDAGEVGWQAEQVDGDHGPRLQLPFGERLLDLPGQGIRVQIERVFIHVAENGSRARQAYDLRRSEKGEVRNEDRVPRADALRHQRHEKSVGAVVRGNAVPAVRIGAELLFQLLHLGPRNEAAVRDHFRDSLVDFRFQVPVLRAEIVKFYFLHLYPPEVHPGPARIFCRISGMRAARPAFPRTRRPSRAGGRDCP